MLLNFGGDLEDLDGIGTCNVSATATGLDESSRKIAAQASPVFDKG
jgi:hypothetical protein